MKKRQKSVGVTFCCRFSSTPQFVGDTLAEELQVSCFVIVGAYLLDVVQLQISLLSSLVDRLRHQRHHHWSHFSSKFSNPCQAGSDQTRLSFHFEAACPWFVACLMFVVAVVWNIILCSTPTAGQPLHPGSQTLRQKSFEWGRQTIRSTLHATCCSARVSSCGVSRSVKMQI